MADTGAERLNLGLLLFIPYRFLESAVLDALREHGHELPLSQARVFQRIDPDGSRMADLAEAAQLSKQTIGSIVDQLERSGYVRRERDPRDARGRIVRITDKGRQVIELTIPVVRRIQADWEAQLGRTRARQLREALETLREITDPFATPRDAAVRR
jgi:DNA-binding MarR family transcriptional regulator